ncbi:MAG: TIGR00725 family protein [Actinomycetota bacterium]|nr:TIGR00725 family protein [Actinomycetota bacterium]
MTYDSGIRRTSYIAVVGPGEVDKETYALAVDVGRLIAERGAVLICGGLGGVMEAAARGVSERGGSSLGILPGDDRGQANQYLTMAIATGLGELRNGLVVGSSDAVLSVGGSWGTLSEVTLALRLGMPVVTLRGWSVLDLDGAVIAGVTVAASAAEAVNAVLSREGGRKLT